MRLLISREVYGFLMSLMWRGRQGTGARVLEREGTAQFSWGCDCRARLCVQYCYVKKWLCLDLGVLREMGRYEVWRLPFWWEWGLPMRGWEHKNPGYISVSEFSDRT